MEAIHLTSFKNRNAPRTTIRKKIPPITRSGYLEWVIKTRTPAAITPLFMITSFDVKIILARMCASLLFPFCNRYKQIEFTIRASNETPIIILKSGISVTAANLRITSNKPIVPIITGNNHLTLLQIIFAG